MSPESAIARLADLVNHQIKYLNGAGCHDVKLPDTESCLCFHISDGEIEYDFGADSHIASLYEITACMKRKGEHTPQKGERKKKSMTSTPKKSSTQI